VSGLTPSTLYEIRIQLKADVTSSTTAGAAETSSATAYLGENLYIRESTKK